MNKTTVMGASLDLESIVYTLNDLLYNKAVIIKKR